MDFNLDDPLGDVLSDDNSFDSFFKSDKPKISSADATENTKKTLLTSASTTKFDLFGMKDSSTEKLSTNLNQEMKKPATETLTTSKKNQDSLFTAPVSDPKPSSSFKTQNLPSNEDDDLISDLGFDPKKPKNTKSGTMFDDLLGIEPNKSIISSSVQRRNPALGSISSAQTVNKEDTKIISRQSTETTDSNLRVNVPRQKISIASETTVNEPLNIFSGSLNKELETTNKEVKDTITIPKSKFKSSTPDWLGLDLEANTQKDPLQKQTENEQQAASQLQQQTNFSASKSPSSVLVSNLSVMPNQTPVLMATANIETQNVIQTLNQQEAQINMTAQMKSQENVLLEMQRRQHELLTQQEVQFNELFQKQLLKNNQIEMNIRLQQERINNLIQFLMSQASIPTHPAFQESDKMRLLEGKENVLDKKNEDKEIQLDVEVKRLELEKMRLEDLLSNINVNHEKEIEFIESSYKKQVEILQDDLEKAKNHYIGEFKYLEESFKKKLALLQSEKDDLQSLYEVKINKLKEDHEAERETLKSQYEENLKLLKENSHNMLENVRQTKLVELATIQDNQSYLETIRNAFGQLENVSEDLQVIRDEITRKIDLDYKEREIKLQAREKRLEDSEKRLKLSEEASELEKKRLIELVTTLEVQLVHLQHDGSEERWNFQQKLSTLEAERVSFEREKQFIREQLTREQKHLDEMKMKQVQEYQRLLQEIQDEKQSLILEKAKLETAKRLEDSNDYASSYKLELEAAIKVAQDATKQADCERKRFYEMQRQLELKRRELIDQENELRRKQDELEMKIINTAAKERQVQDTLQQQRLEKQDFLAKNQLLQMQMRRVAEREMQLSQNKLALSNEHINLLKLKQKLEQNKCSLCRIGEKNADTLRNVMNYKDSSQDEGIDLRDGLITPNTIYDIQPSRVDNIFEENVNEALRTMETLNIIKANLPSDFVVTDAAESKSITRDQMFSMFDSVDAFIRYMKIEMDKCKQAEPTEQKESEL